MGARSLERITRKDAEEMAIARLAAKLVLVPALTDSALEELLDEICGNELTGYLIQEEAQ